VLEGDRGAAVHERAGNIIAAVHVVLVDPVATSPPYDHELAGALARRGHTVDLLTSPFPFGPVPAPDGYRRDELFLAASGRILRRNPRSRLRLALKGVEYLPSVGRMWLRLRQLRPDVVHVQWLPLPRVDLQWVRRLTRPTVFTAHHALPRDEGAGMEARLRAYEAVARVIVHSRRVLDELAALGVPRERLAYIPHPVFTTANARPEPPSGSTLLFFGLLRAYKGLDVLVRALPLVPEARLVVAGDPLDPVEDVRRLAEETGVADRIEWRLGFLPDSEVDELMREAAAVVLPYRRTDASGVLATAIGHGRPAVVTDVGSLGETVRDFGAGEVVPPGDHEALAAACARLLGDDAALDAAYRGALAAREALTWDSAAEAHERVYEAVLSA
jgi:glycosyltransferase involved in cell wall biosynthesis